MLQEVLGANAKFGERSAAVAAGAAETIRAGMRGARYLIPQLLHQPTATEIVMLRATMRKTAMANPLDDKT